MGARIHKRIRFDKVKFEIKKEDAQASKPIDNLSERKKKYLNKKSTESSDPNREP